MTTPSPQTNLRREGGGRGAPFSQHVTENAWTLTKVNFRLSPSANQRRNPCSGFPAVYQVLSTRHGSPLKKATVQLAYQIERKLEEHF